MQLIIDKRWMLSPSGAEVAIQLNIQLMSLLVDLIFVTLQPLLMS
jgi:hypothetical protein